MKPNSSINSNTSRYIVDLPQKLLIHQYQLSLSKDDLDSLIDKLEILKQFKAKYGPSTSSAYDTQNKMLVIHRPLNPKETDLATIHKLHVDIKRAKSELDELEYQNVDMNSRIEATYNEIQKYHHKLAHATENIQILNQKFKELESKLSKNLPLNIFSWKQIVDYCKQTHEDDQKIKAEQEEIKKEIQRLNSAIKHPTDTHLIKNIETFKMHLRKQEQELERGKLAINDRFLSQQLEQIHQNQDKYSKTVAAILPMENTGFKMSLEQIIKDHTQDLQACRDFLKQYPENNPELNRLLGLK